MSSATASDVPEVGFRKSSPSLLTKSQEGVHERFVVIYVTVFLQKTKQFGEHVMCNPHYAQSSLCAILIMRNPHYAQSSLCAILIMRNPIMRNPHYARASLCASLVMRDPHYARSSLGRDPHYLNCILFL